MYCILIYRGKSDKHARLRAVLGCKPWKIWYIQNWFHFRRRFESAMGGKYLYPQGLKEVDENWLLESIGQNLDP